MTPKSIPKPSKIDPKTGPRSNDVFGSNFDYFYLPLILFTILSGFAVGAYVFELNFGNDDYQTWNIGFNPSGLDYLKGRINGFQAGGPNSFADLITITAVYSLFKYK